MFDIFDFLRVNVMCSHLLGLNSISQSVSQFCRALGSACSWSRLLAVVSVTVSSANNRTSDLTDWGRSLM